MTVARAPSAAYTPPAPKPMKPTPLIRPAILEDAPEIARLVERYWEFEKIPGFKFSRIESLLRAFLNDPREWSRLVGDFRR